jgi:hypothetical protein
MSQLSASYWRDIRRRALKPMDWLDWVQQGVVLVLFLGLLLFAFGRDRAVEELATTALGAFAAVLCAGGFLILRLGQAAFASHVDALKAIQSLEAERDAARHERDSVQAQLNTRRKNQQLANELERLRAYGLHSIRNEFEAHRNNLAEYLDRERRWAAEIRRTMEQGDCTAMEIGSVMDITNSEIGRAAAGASYGPDENWLIGLLEMRLARLTVVIHTYAGH